MTLNAKLVVGILVLVGVTAYLAYVGAATSWQYYVVVDECVGDARTLEGLRLRVSGRVAPNSLDVPLDRREATFVLQGTRHTLRVSCPAPLPDNLKEDIDVVVEGVLFRADNAAGDQGEHFLRGEKVITRCASKYQSQPNE
jgi:cytochrome c-type biogenesis protein CcmE